MFEKMAEMAEREGFEFIFYLTDSRLGLVPFLVNCPLRCPQLSTLQATPRRELGSGLID